MFVLAHKDKNLIKWLYKIIDRKDKHIALTGIHCQENLVEATNGYVYLAAETTLYSADGKKILGLYDVNGHEITPIEAQFPDTKLMVQGAKDLKGLRVKLNPKYLKDILPYFSGEIELKVPEQQNSPVEITGKAEDGTPLYALIMPMR